MHNGIRIRPLFPDIFPGINKVDASLKEQLVTIEGTAAPSAIVAAIEATGRDAILRGSGKSNSKAPPALVQQESQNHIGFEWANL